jgi:uncharacterized protein (DUF983 family)
VKCPRCKSGHLFSVPISDTDRCPDVPRNLYCDNPDCDYDDAVDLVAEAYQKKVEDE